ncbi:uncharacterized protein MONOS_2606 [Monocercomonoides exilis]|uniref:uncharacterized protein n=1 Tax=Monocercomonoides exilis TaxID=2049356 RepID=UPI003559A5C0|nr:hypothetical protein MONOS_2606 [Monocercomonoides exilis]|eukprot:MONOS_2606.1-p1 / transcript=MONOS_2606.1 / gene=MONOS_2606 / organism=Monocercomonoides_exilis_PA203 / gene_product=unspecified product / transcript_product=unspecified product / location=Mono_scaffold00054:159705-164663(-) / protein_length=1604 / sequence_SO=supercontig / SO=protein_coding / is_pseudo=false
MFSRLSNDYFEQNIKLPHTLDDEDLLSDSFSSNSKDLKEKVAKLTEEKQKQNEDKKLRLIENFATQDSGLLRIGVETDPELSKLERRKAMNKVGGILKDNEKERIIITQKHPPSLEKKDCTQIRNKQNQHETWRQSSIIPKLENYQRDQQLDFRRAEQEKYAAELADQIKVKKQIKTMDENISYLKANYAKTEDMKKESDKNVSLQGISIQPRSKLLASDAEEEDKAMNDYFQGKKFNVCDSDEFDNKEDLWEDEYTRYLEARERKSRRNYSPIDDNSVYNKQKNDWFERKKEFEHLQLNRENEIDQNFLNRESKKENYPDEEFYMCARDYTKSPSERKPWNDGHSSTDLNQRKLKLQKEYCRDSDSRDFHLAGEDKRARHMPFSPASSSFSYASHYSPSQVENTFQQRQCAKELSEQAVIQKRVEQEKERNEKREALLRERMKKKVEAEEKSGSISDEWFQGFGKEGGGAPFRDEEGNIIAVRGRRFNSPQVKQQIQQLSSKMPLSGNSFYSLDARSPLSAASVVASPPAQSTFSSYFSTPASPASPASPSSLLSTPPFSLLPPLSEYERKQKAINQYKADLALQIAEKKKREAEEKRKEKLQEEEDDRRLAREQEKEDREREEQERRQKNKTNESSVIGTPIAHKEEIEAQDDTDVQEVPDIMNRTMRLNQREIEEEEKSRVKNDEYVADDEEEADRTNDFEKDAMKELERDASAASLMIHDTNSASLHSNSFHYQKHHTHQREYNHSGRHKNEKGKDTHHRHQRYSSDESDVSSQSLSSSTLSPSSSSSLSVRNTSSSTSRSSHHHHHHHRHRDHHNNHKHHNSHNHQHKHANTSLSPLNQDLLLRALLGAPLALDIGKGQLHGTLPERLPSIKSDRSDETDRQAAKNEEIGRSHKSDRAPGDGLLSRTYPNALSTLSSNRYSTPQTHSFYSVMPSFSPISLSPMNTSSASPFHFNSPSFISMQQPHHPSTLPQFLPPLLPASSKNMPFMSANMPVDSSSSQSLHCVTRFTLATDHPQTPLPNLRGIFDEKAAGGNEIEGENQSGKETMRDQDDCTTRRTEKEREKEKEEKEKEEEEQNRLEELFLMSRCEDEQKRRILMGILEEEEQRLQKEKEMLEEKKKKEEEDEAERVRIEEERALLAEESQQIEEQRETVAMMMEELLQKDQAAINRRKKLKEKERQNSKEAKELMEAINLEQQRLDEARERTQMGMEEMFMERRKIEEKEKKLREEKDAVQEKLLEVEMKEEERKEEIKRKEELEMKARQEIEEAKEQALMECEEMLQKERENNALTQQQLNEQLLERMKKEEEERETEINRKKEEEKENEEKKRKEEERRMYVEDMLGQIEVERRRIEKGKGIEVVETKEQENRKEDKDEDEEKEKEKEKEEKTEEKQEGKEETKEEGNEKIDEKPGTEKESTEAGDPTIEKEKEEPIDKKDEADNEKEREKRIEEENIERQQETNVQLENEEGAERNGEKEEKEKEKEENEKKDEKEEDLKGKEKEKEKEVKEESEEGKGVNDGKERKEEKEEKEENENKEIEKEKETNNVMKGDENEDKENVRESEDKERKGNQTQLEEKEKQKETKMDQENEDATKPSIS